MKVLWITLVILVGLGSPTISPAQGIPGADDPALRAAAEAWLSGDDPRPALRAIGELAADGNPAARLLARSLEHWLFLDFPQMSRKERRALFPPDRSGRDSGFAAYPVAREDAPAAFLATGMHLSKTPDEWIARATALLEAGLRQVFLQQLRVALSYPHLNVEAARFAEDVVTDADPEQSELWYFRLLERSRLEFLEVPNLGEAAALRSRWGGSPWSPRAETAFTAALAAGRWSAIRVAGTMASLGVEVPVDAPTARQYERWVALDTAAHTLGPPDHPAPSGFELDRLGEVLLREAAHSPHLRPIRTACEAHCPDATLRCMATAVLRHGSRPAEVPVHLEPLVPAGKYLSSGHAARQFLARSGAADRAPALRPDWLPVPQCFRDAAQREATRAFPADRTQTPN